jgi:hypothetical protein
MEGKGGREGEMGEGKMILERNGRAKMEWDWEEAIMGRGREEKW